MKGFAKKISMGALALAVLLLGAYPALAAHVDANGGDHKIPGQGLVGDPTTSTSETGPSTTSDLRPTTSKPSTSRVPSGTTTTSIGVTRPATTSRPGSLAPGGGDGDGGGETGDGGYTGGQGATGGGARSRPAASGYRGVADSRAVSASRGTRSVVSSQATSSDSSTSSMASSLPEDSSRALQAIDPEETPEGVVSMVGTSGWFNFLLSLVLLIASLILLAQALMQKNRKALPYLLGALGIIPIVLFCLLESFSLDAIFTRWTPLYVGITSLDVCCWVYYHLKIKKDTHKDLE